MPKEKIGERTVARATNETGSAPALATWWMICRFAGGGVEAMTVPCHGGRALALFGHEEEAAWFLGDEGSDTGWWIRESRCGEVTSMLCGPCASVERVVLDPLPATVADRTATLASLDRTSFLAGLLATGGPSEGPNARRTPRCKPFGRRRRGV